MAKVKSIFVCGECGASAPKWVGQCPGCAAWNTLVETALAGDAPARAGLRFVDVSPDARPRALNEVAPEPVARRACGLAELDRALGGGLVAGSVVLIGGDPGIGKSTLLLQALAHLGSSVPALYVTGEESPEQIALRGLRLGLASPGLRLIAENQIERIVAAAARERPAVAVIDSIQTVYTEMLASAPGSVAQVRESAAQLVRFAKQTGMSLFLVGHVTKEGSIAGPRVLEHMVDAVLYFDGDSLSRFRMIRAIKNRFGPVNDIGVFVMTETGLREVPNPSAMFLNQREEPVPGSAVLVTQEGSRPLLVEVQALVDESHASNPRRVSVGLDGNRLAMLLAVLHRHGGIAMYDQDVFVNVVGGVRVMETAADLAVLLAAVSSLRNKAIPKDTVLFGEVGLAGEVRPVARGQERIREAEKLGFKRALVPAANRSRRHEGALEVVGVKRLSEALEILN